MRALKGVWVGTWMVAEVEDMDGCLLAYREAWMES